MIETVATRDINLPTDFGTTLVVTVTDPTHMHVETHRNLPIVVRGARLRVSLHLSLYDGVWSLTRNESGREERHYLSVKKVDCTDWRKEDASDSARSKVLELIAARINEWMQTNAGKKVLAQLQLDAAELQLSSSKAIIEKLTKELKDEKAKLPTLEEEVVAARHVMLSLTK